MSELRPAPGSKIFIGSLFGGFAGVIGVSAVLGKVWDRGIGQWGSALAIVMVSGLFAVLFCIRAGIWADQDRVIVVSPFGRRRSAPRREASKIFFLLNRTVITDEHGEVRLTYPGCPWREKDVNRCETSGMSPTIQRLWKRRQR